MIIFLGLWIGMLGLALCSMVRCISCQHRINEVNERVSKDIKNLESSGIKIL